MATDQIQNLSIARSAAFGVTGAGLLGLGILVLFGSPELLHLAWWSWAAGLGLAAVVFALGLVGGRRTQHVLWDETAQADQMRSQKWAYLVAIVGIFPILAVSILLGLDPLRGFIAAGLFLGATQLLLFCVFDRLGR